MNRTLDKLKNLSHLLEKICHLAYDILFENWLSMKWSQTVSSVIIHIKMKGKTQAKLTLDDNYKLYIYYLLNKV